MAFAGAEFASLAARALKGESGIKACSYIENDLTDAKFFATPVTLGTDGVQEIHSFGKMSDFEQKNFDSMIGDLIGQIKKGEDFAAKL